MELGIEQTRGDAIYRYCDACPAPSAKTMPPPPVAAQTLPVVQPVSQPAPVPRVRKWTIRFALGKAVVEDTEALRAIATALETTPGASVFVSGHTDALGNAGFNRKLADRRAKSVVEALRRAGVEAKRIHYDSLCCIDNPPINNPPARKAAVIVYLETDEGESNGKP